jgi:hypothetical protein
VRYPLIYRSVRFVCACLLIEGEVRTKFQGVLNENLIVLDISYSLL